MKKILLILLVLFLTACGFIESKLEKLNYTQEEIETIKTFDEETRELFLGESNGLYRKYLRLDGFKVEHLQDYVSFNNELSDEMVVRLVNDGILNTNNLSKIKDLYNSEYFIEKNEELYLKYFDDYDNVRDLLEIVNTKRYIPLYNDIQITDVTKEYTILVNKYYQLPSDYEPNDLVDIDPELGRGQTRQAVYDAYLQLYDEAISLDYNLYIASAYRSYDYQDGLYNKYLLEDSKENVDTYSARPGHSEHQSGLCLDVTIPGYSLDDFYLTNASSWLNDNCYKYGFIIRYPLNKENITGYQAEPWQIRFVGKGVAKDIYERGITFDEYYACFLDK